MERKLDPALAALYKSGAKVYSISRANTIDQCLYQAYLTYGKRVKGRSSVYGILGGKVHDTLEEIVNGLTSENVLPDVVDNELLDIDLAGIDFPSFSVRANWRADMLHFARHFVRPSGTFQTEKLVLYPLKKDRWVQGYVDLIRIIDADKKLIEVYDWKTSTDFKKDDLIHHGRQLVFYKMALEREGFTVRKTAWIMLKYVSVSSPFLRKPKIIERRKIGAELSLVFEKALTEKGVPEYDRKKILVKAREDNEIPLLLTDLFKVVPYVRPYEVTDELEKECTDYLNRAADLFEAGDLNDLSYWKPVKITDENSFFCRVLCAHGETCPYLKAFL